MNFQNCTPGFPVPVLSIYVLSICSTGRLDPKRSTKALLGIPWLSGERNGSGNRERHSMYGFFPPLKSKSNRQFAPENWMGLEYDFFLLFGAKGIFFRSYGSFREGSFLNVVHFHGKCRVDIPYTLSF